MTPTPPEVSPDMPQLRELTYPDVARQVVAQLAPQELPLLEDVIQAWLDGDLEGRGPVLGESLGSGLDPHLTAEIVLPIVASAVSAVANDAALGSAHRVWRRLRRRRRPETRIPAPLTSEQLELVREAVHDAAVHLGIGSRRAEALADAVWGILDRHQRGEGTVQT